jgi:hypothetical protein
LEETNVAFAEAIAGKLFPEHFEGNWWCATGRNCHRGELKSTVALDGSIEMDSLRQFADRFGHCGGGYIFAVKSERLPGFLSVFSMFRGDIGVSQKRKSGTVAGFTVYFDFFIRFLLSSFLIIIGPL